MDILAALVAEESRLKQQLDTIRAAIKIVIRETKSPTEKQPTPSANFTVENRHQRPLQS